MSRHPSYGKAAKSVAKRSVLKRFERIKEMKERKRWGDEDRSVFHLPKLKQIG